MEKYLVLSEVEAAAKKLPHGHWMTWRNSNARLSFTLPNGVVVEWNTRVLQRINGRMYFPAYSADATHVRVLYREDDGIDHNDVHLRGKGARDSYGTAYDMLSAALGLTVAAKVTFGPQPPPDDYRIFRGTPAEFFNKAAADLAAHDAEKQERK